MNGSQLLYRISDLKYAIGRKESEYREALISNEELKKSEHSHALILLREALRKANAQLESLESNAQKLDSIPLKRRRPFLSWVFRRSFFGKKF
jgi:hypothetical protein